MMTEDYFKGVTMNWHERIAINPDVLVGKPVIKGTRLAVEFIIELLLKDGLKLKWCVITRVFSTKIFKLAFFTPVKCFTLKKFTPYPEIELDCYAFSCQ